MATSRCELNAKEVQAALIPLHGHRFLVEAGRVGECTTMRDSGTQTVIVLFTCDIVSVAIEVKAGAVSGQRLR